MSNLYQNSKIREQSAPLIFSQPRHQKFCPRLLNPIFGHESQNGSRPCHGSPTLWDSLGQLGLRQPPSWVQSLSRDRASSVGIEPVPGTGTASSVGMLPVYGAGDRSLLTPPWGLVQVACLYHVPVPTCVTCPNGTGSLPVPPFQSRHLTKSLDRGLSSSKNQRSPNWVSKIPYRKSKLVENRD